MARPLRSGSAAADNRTMRTLEAPTVVEVDPPVVRFLTAVGLSVCTTSLYLAGQAFWGLFGGY